MSKRSKKRRDRLFDEQHGRCACCGGFMIKNQFEAESSGQHDAHMSLFRYFDDVSDQEVILGVRKDCMSDIRKKGVDISAAA